MALLSYRDFTHLFSSFCDGLTFISHLHSIKFDLLSLLDSFF